MIRETDQLQPELLRLAPYRIPELRLFRRNILRAKIDGRIIQAGIKGQCDLWGVTRGGTHVEIELKSIRGSLTPEQRSWGAFCVEWRVPYVALKAHKGESCQQTAERWCVEIRRVLGI